ncbi:VWA domain-containing protein [Flavobacterium cerinum]|uniref:VWA domain-containing protein n=1 Tax=Flavobacterium cerinum TaxID=2502784 RepID=A0ABY5IUN5_9FLAO|nr:VWA domain-containing protein [Flavobacterium cerinum]UUC46480.1 VWA domain-containing protein [Flavobacterium cerinum]
MRNLVLIVFLLLSGSTVFAQVTPEERQALIDIYNSTNGKEWKNNKGWDVNNPKSVVTSWDAAKKTGWYGVTVKDGHVTDIVLNDNNLVGELNADPEAFQALTRFLINGNNVTGELAEGLLEPMEEEPRVKKKSVPTEIKATLINSDANEILTKVADNPTVVTSDKKRWASCTVSNPNSAAAKNIFLNFIKYLVNAKNSGVQDYQIVGSNPPQFNALKPYITDPNPKIANFSTAFDPSNNSLAEMRLSFTGDHGEYDVWLSGNFSDIANVNFDVDISQYDTPDHYLDLQGDYSPMYNGYKIFLKKFDVMHVNFCPDKIDLPICHEKTRIQVFSSTNQMTLCAGQFIKLVLSPYMSSAEYHIQIVKSDGTIIDLGTIYGTNEVYFNSLEAGTYTIKVEGVNYDEGCTFSGELNNVVVQNCATFCASNNTTSPIVKQLYLNLLNHLISKMQTDGYIADGYAPSQLISLSPYISDPNPKIYNAHFTNNNEYFRFSFANHASDYDVSLRYTPNTTVTGLDMSGFVSTASVSTLPVLLNTSAYQPSHTVKHINFCPPAPIYCTTVNPNAPIIKNLFIGLINKLRTLPNASVPNGYTCTELTVLAPYITDATPKIYNFNNTGATISFSFNPHGSQYDVVVPLQSNLSITNVEFDNYVLSDVVSTFKTTFSNGYVNTTAGRVKHINLCPDELYCVSHVAIVVDESGSLDDTEIRKIKKQLKAFVQQQADTNDNLGTNIYISLIGMSDNDLYNRGDAIMQVKVTNGSTLNQFNNWINNYGARYGQPGISPASDYWNGALQKALQATMKPDAVIMITDGCETANVTNLVTTMKSFNNYRNPANPATSLTPNGPHLYVLGIENGFYVDSETVVSQRMARNQDPNYNPTMLKTTGSDLVAGRIAAVEHTDIIQTQAESFLRKSLKFLLGYPADQFPVSSIDFFDPADYFGHENFNILGSDERYLSEKLVDSQISCGLSITKDFCEDCYSFQPQPGQEYILSAWAKEETNEQFKTFNNPAITLIFYNNKQALPQHEISRITVTPSGEIIDGWQRIFTKFMIPYSTTSAINNTISIGVELKNNSPSIPVYFDDIRVHPLKGSMKSFVYDPETFKLMSELDDNNYATFYEYDNEGGLVRIKKETERGVKTIQETRSGNVIKN